MTTALVSVVMPVYNAAGTLPAAIESVLAQTESRLELIVVDDCSTDSTPVILESFRRLDPRVRIVVNEQNSRRGPVEWEPRNDGLRYARAPAIAYLDADNTWRPDFLSRMLEVLRDQPSVQLVHCDSCNHYSAAEKLAVKTSDHRHLVDEGETWTVCSYERLDRALLGTQQYIDTNEMLHRTSVFERLRSLWSTAHPRRAEINRLQGGRRPQRRHNDVHLAERIIDEYGLDAVFHLPQVLVDFYYESCDRTVPTSRA